ncbi:guanine deaminase [Ruania albidiflava]|uniref:guanine deaminase n=1 Tax=Ruania albidiflava TaxID=366586 RepID=UPI0023F01D6D|nr:guanine deaminase [Ruania albidiflava]
MTTTIYRARALDVPSDPFTGGQLRADEDVALTVTDGTITARGPFAEARAQAPGAELVDLRAGVLLPGFVDTHVHYPQVRAIGGLGMPLLDWLDQCALPEEEHMADDAYAGQVAGEFLAGLAQAGTTSALVFGAHQASAMDVFFAAAEGCGLRITAGLVVGDRLLKDALHTTPEAALADAGRLIEAWHGRGKLRYAVTPRFSLSATDELLAACGETFTSREDLYFTSHLNENPAEVDTVAELFPASAHYLDTYDRHGLLGPRSILAHDVHPVPAELTRMAETGVSVAHCPSSNASLGSGLFPMRAHLDAGVHVALGSDVGGGTGFSLLKEGLQAYFTQQARPDGVPLAPEHLLHLATSAGARALGLDQVGHLSTGMAFDAVWFRPQEGSTTEAVLRHAASAGDALAKIFALGTNADIAGVWVGGHQIRG